jgi:hypothetical protein
MVLAQQVEHLFRLGGFGEGGEAAQVAEHDDDVAAVAFEDVLLAARDDHLGQLRRQKPLEAPHALQFAELSGDARRQFAVHRRDLVGARAQFAQESRILPRDDRLRGAVLQQRDLLVCEWPHLRAVNQENTEHLLVSA